MNRKIYNYIGIIALFFSLITSCKQDGDFDNKVYLVSPQLETIINKATVTNESKSFRVGMAKPEPNDININVRVENSLLNAFNVIHKEKAELLSNDNYSLSTNSIQIRTGSVVSDNVQIDFKNINSLDREKVYVLPVEINSSNIEVVDSKKIIYYVVKGGALINVVGNMDGNYLGTSSFKTPSALQNLGDFTMEGLIYPRELNKLISTVMGVEGYFLLRIGDAGVPPNRLQIAASSGNRTITTDIPLNKWTHIAVVYKKSEQLLKVFYDGKEVYTANNVNYPNLNLARTDFLIGKSYDNNRSFNGEFSEFRIWNVARTVEDIAATPYEVPTNSTGLVAYWKINEGSGSVIKDHTVNGNDLTANTAIKWVPVELPARSN